MIKVESLSKFYGPHQALDQLNFSITPGEIVGFLGPNGAGKSTTMNILTGALSLSEGNVHINGHDIFTEAREARRSVGYLPEQPPLYPELTVREYLNHICALKKLKRKTWKTERERILPMCHLETVATRKIANLSKGFRQRVGLAQALVGSPPLLILDEPTAGLDPQQILEIRSLIRQLGNKHTVLLSSHILSEIEAICERVLILQQGRLVADDRTALLSQKLNAESCQLRLEILAPTENRKDNQSSEGKSSEENALAEILAAQNIGEFSCTVQMVSASPPQTTERLYSLEFQVPGMELGLRKQLSRALHNGGFAIVAMQTQHHSLEDIFLDLTTPKMEPHTEPHTEIQTETKEKP